MYLNESSRNILLGYFTNSELITGVVSDERLRKLFASDNIKISTAKISSNNYGEFMFINFSYNGVHMMAYGYGYHEYRDRYYYDDWFFTDSSNYYPMAPIVDKKSMFDDMDTRKSTIKKYAKGHQTSDHGYMFAEIADMADDDYAISEMEDMGYY